VFELPPYILAADHPPGERDRDPALPLVDEDDEDQQNERDQNDDGELDLAALLEDVLNPWGWPATTLAKIRIDMPWPMPRWVISSASHMTKAVPGGQGQTMKSGPPDR
jgi:hypothetical protein